MLWVDLVIAQLNGKKKNREENNHMEKSTTEFREEYIQLCSNRTTIIRKTITSVLYNRPSGNRLTNKTASIGLKKGKVSRNPPKGNYNPYWHQWIEKLT